LPSSRPQVLGLNQQYRDYSDKIRSYHDYLLKDSLDTVMDDDVVVLMDAYDVLLLPAARSFGAVSPILIVPSQ